MQIISWHCKLRFRTLENTCGVNSLTRPSVAPRQNNMKTMNKLKKGTNTYAITSACRDCSGTNET